MNADNKRIAWIDIAKGIGIISVVIAHDISGGVLNPIIYSFHMPLFFIINGMLFKCRNESFVLECKKDLYHLLLPCIYTRAIIMGLNSFCYGKPLEQELKSMIFSLLWGNHHGSIGGLTPPPIGRIWFLIALFWTRVLYRLLLKHFQANARVSMLVLLSLISMFTGTHGIVLPHNLDMIFVCTLFMEVGQALKSIDLDSFNIWISIGIFAAWTYLSCYQNIWISMNMRLYPGYGLCILVAIAGCICVFKFSRAIESCWFSNGFRILGKNSLIVLCVHTIEMYIALPNQRMRVMLGMMELCGCTVLGLIKENCNKHEPNRL